MINMTGRFALILILWGSAEINTARSEELPAIAAGFRPHVSSQKGGAINWTSGEIIATGIGKARSNKAADRLGANRAASLVAARNALAIANGIQFDGNGRVGNVRDGQITVEGVVKGQRVVETVWDKNKNPLECRIKLSVPLWGATGICNVFSDSQKRSSLQRRVRRLALAEGHADLGDAVLVVDARGRRIEECLFPSILTDDGAVLYDIATRGDARAISEPPLRYVETDITFEKLRACLEAPKRPTAHGPRFVLAIHDWMNGIGSIDTMQSQAGFAPTLWSALDMADAASSQPTTASATSQPTRRRIVVKAVEPAQSKAQSQIVLTKEDAEKLRRSPEGASLLRNGRVIVVVDSAAAGMQGRLPHSSDETSLASSARR